MIYALTNLDQFLFSFYPIALSSLCEPPFPYTYTLHTTPAPHVTIRCYHIIHYMCTLHTILAPHVTVRCYHIIHHVNFREHDHPTMVVSEGYSLGLSVKSLHRHFQEYDDPTAVALSNDLCGVCPNQSNTKLSFSKFTATC